jgi:hypothetical protein
MRPGIKRATSPCLFPSRVVKLDGQFQTLVCISNSFSVELIHQYSQGFLKVYGLKAEY